MASLRRNETLPVAEVDHEQVSLALLIAATTIVEYLHLDITDLLTNCYDCLNRQCSPCDGRGESERLLDITDGLKGIVLPVACNSGVAG